MLPLQPHFNENTTGICDGDARDAKREHRLNLVDPAPIPFERVASGKAGDLLARDWFLSSAAELGALSLERVARKGPGGIVSRARRSPR